MRALILIFLAVLAASAAELPPLTAWPSPTATGEWPAYRGDPAQTGRAERAGRIVTPRVAWRCALGTWQAWLEVSPVAGRRAVELPEAALLEPEYLSRQRAEWDPDVRLLDLAGDGRLQRVKIDHNVRYAHFLPEAKGFQKFVMEDGMAVKTRPDGPHRPVARGTLYRYDHGREELVWQTEPEEQCEVPLVGVADIDGDGLLDIAVSTWWRVMVYDARTGRRKDECKWHNGRNYGHFQLADLDGDGRPEAIVFADFMIHQDVLANQATGYKLRWRHEVDFKLFGKRKVLRCLPDAVVRVPGRPALLAANLYNDTGDGRWHAVLLDGMSGDVVRDWPDRLIAGQASGPALLLERTVGACRQPCGELSVIMPAAGDWSERPLPVRGRWLEYDAPLPDDRATIAAEGRRTALVTTAAGGPLAWVVCPREGGEELVAVRLTAEGLAVAGRLPLPAGLSAGAARRSADGQRVLLAVSGAAWPAERLNAEGVQAELRSVAPLRALPDVPVVARLAPNGPPLVLAADGAGQVAAVQAPRGAGEPQVLWRRPGRAQGANYEYEHLGLTVADLPAGRVVLAALQTPDGRAALVGYNAAGREVQRHVFPDRFPGGLSTWNSGGLTGWQAVPRPDGKADVLASLRRSVMHTDETCRLDGADGRERWWCDSVIERGCGGKPFALARQADGGTMLIDQYPDIHAALDGATGRTLLAAQYPMKELGGWSGYSYPILLDADGHGLGVVSSGCNYFVGLWSPTGTLRWHTGYLDGSVHQLGVRRHDGRWELGVPAFRGGFKCLDAATGKPLWAWPQRPTTDVVTADIDGDGEEEFLFGLGDTLVALGTNKVKWELKLPTPCGAPVAADVDGDGRLEVVVMGGDGAVYAVGGE